MAAIVVSVLRHLHYPVFADPPIRAQAENRWIIRLPIMRGLHAVLAELTQTVVALLAELGAGRDPTEEMLRELKQRIAALEARVPNDKVTPALIDAAQAAGIPWQRLSQKTFQFGSGSRLRWFAGSVSDQTPYLGATTTENKLLTAQLLAAQMLPAPKSGQAHTVEDAVGIAEQMGYPVVVKPVDRNRGEGVFARLENTESVRAAYGKARELSENIMVEQHIAGVDHRLHVFGGSVYRAGRRIPGGVTGDGVATIAILLERLNAERERSLAGGRRDPVPIDRDDEAERMLAEQSLSWDSIPGDGQFVALRSIANVSTGGTRFSISLDDIHPDNIAMAERAVGLFGLDIAAVDFICPDIGRSWTDVGGAICEINAGPQFGDDAAEKILASLFPDQGRIPVGMVLGDAGSAAWLTELREKLNGQGVTLGMVLDGEAWIGDRLIARLPEQSAFEGAMLLLRERRVEQLIVKVDAGFRKHGVPCEGIDWLAIDRPQMDDDARALASLVTPFAKQVLVHEDLEVAGAAPTYRPVSPDRWAAAILDL
ncbi:MAG: hypothetical protein R3E09_02065 [Novosphingobium sp.]